MAGFVLSFRSGLKDPALLRHSASRKHHVETLFRDEFVRWARWVDRKILSEPAGFEINSRLGRCF
jgi:hypothetical protein